MKLVPILCIIIMFAATCSLICHLLSAVFLVGQFLSSSAIVLSLCSSITFSISTWTWSSLDPESISHPYQVHLVFELRKQKVNARFYQLAISPTLHRLNDVMERCYTICRTSFWPWSPTSHSGIVFIKSARKSHTLPPAKLLQQTPLDLHLTSACVWPLLILHHSIVGPLVVWHLLASCGLELRESFLQFNQVCPCRRGAHRRNFLTLSLHILSADDSLRPFQSTGLRYSCMRNWVVWRSPRLARYRMYLALKDPENIFEKIPTNSRSTHYRMQ